LVRRILGELEHGLPADDTIVRGLLWSMAGLLRRYSQGRAAVPAPAPEGLHRLLPALDHIARHFAEPISIPELASRTGMSVTSFRRHFARAVGRSPLDYLTQVRVEMAALLLNQEEGILEASMAVGYESPSTFYRHFRRLKGMSPQAWKTRSRVAAEA